MQEEEVKEHSLELRVSAFCDHASAYTFSMPVEPLPHADYGPSAFLFSMLVKDH